jgi:hypothetical protein
VGMRIYRDLCLPLAGGFEGCTALVLPSALLLKVCNELRRVLGAAGERLWGAPRIRLNLPNSSITIEWIHVKVPRKGCGSGDNTIVRVKGRREACSSLRRHKTSGNQRRLTKRRPVAPSNPRTRRFSKWAFEPFF